MAESALFVVGSSRSGTTLMGRMLGQLPGVFTFQELHFFEGLWSGDPARLDAARATRLLALLLQRQHGGLFHPGDGSDWRAPAEALAATLRQPDAMACYRAFLFSEAATHGAQMPCEQTPRNVFWIDEILARLPDARVIVMVRDPRDVLLSQKNRWRRRELGAGAIPRREAARAWLNYHPLVTARLWQAALDAGQRAAADPRVRLVRFEELVAEPERVARGLCDFVGLPYTPAMLAMPQVGSSHRADNPANKGIDAGVVGNWRAGGLSHAEIVLCEFAARRGMAQLGYARSGLSPWRPAVAGQAALLPLRLGLALLFNLGHFGSFLTALRRRLAR